MTNNLGTDLDQLRLKLAQGKVLTVKAMRRMLGLTTAGGLILAMVSRIDASFHFRPVLATYFLLLAGWTIMRMPNAYEKLVELRSRSRRSKKLRRERTATGPDCYAGPNPINELRPVFSHNSNVATVGITVNPFNDAPIARDNDDIFNLNKDTTLNVVATLQISLEREADDLLAIDLVFSEFDQ